MRAWIWGGVLLTLLAAATAVRAEDDPRADPPLTEEQQKEHDAEICRSTIS